MVEDFQYLGSWIDNSETDVKAAAHGGRPLPMRWVYWLKCMQYAWRGTYIPAKCGGHRSNRSTFLRLWIVDKLLGNIYGYTWTSTLYGNLPKLSDKIRRRQLSFAGHCRRSEDELASKLVLLTPKHGQRKQGRPALTYLDVLAKDTGQPADELDNCMQIRKVWRSITARAGRWPLALSQVSQVIIRV